MITFHKVYENFENFILDKKKHDYVSVTFLSWQKQIIFKIENKSNSH